MESEKRDYCIRSEEIAAIAGLYKTIIDEKKNLLKLVSDKYGISYDELILKYAPTSTKFGND